jgi:hypothetical protein
MTESRPPFLLCLGLLADALDVALFDVAEDVRLGGAREDIPPTCSGIACPTDAAEDGVLEIPRLLRKKPNGRLRLAGRHGCLIDDDRAHAERDGSARDFFLKSCLQVLPGAEGHRIEVACLRRRKGCLLNRRQLLLERLEVDAVA